MEIAFRKSMRYDGKNVWPWVSHFTSLGFRFLIYIMKELDKVIANIILALKFYDPQTIESINHL